MTSLVFIALSCCAGALSLALGLPWKLVCTILIPIQLGGIVRSCLRDPYFGDFHASLNEGETSEVAGGAYGTTTTTRSRTEWINVGYWKNTTDFPTACKALALKLIAAAKCKPGGVVLDVGHGCGDSLLLHLQDSSVTRPQRLVGITSQHHHHLRALERTANHNPDSVDVVLYEGDVLYRSSSLSGHTAARHPLDASQCKNTYTTVLALDCAFHFNTRRTFLEQSFTCLAPHGRIALADLCFAPGSISLSTKALLFASGTIPLQNAITTEEYIATLCTIGYVDVTLEDITQDVFPAFVKFLKGRGYAFGLLASHFEGLVSRGLRCVIVSATKPGIGPHMSDVLRQAALGFTTCGNGENSGAEACEKVKGNMSRMRMTISRHLKDARSATSRSFHIGDDDSELWRIPTPL